MRIYLVKVGENVFEYLPVSSENITVTINRSTELIGISGLIGDLIRSCGGTFLYMDKILKIQCYLIDIDYIIGDKPENWVTKIDSYRKSIIRDLKIEELI